MEGLSRQEIIFYLQSLSKKLFSQGIKGELFLVGETPMALAYNKRRITLDLDGVFEPKLIIYEAAKQVALEENLPIDWLNDAVKGFLPGQDTKAKVLLDFEGLSVKVASPRYLFAMKALASRQSRDIEDIKILYALSNFGSIEEAIEYISNIYGNRPIEAKVKFILQEILSTL